MTAAFQSCCCEWRIRFSSSLLIHPTLPQVDEYQHLSMDGPQPPACFCFQIRPESSSVFIQHAFLSTAKFCEASTITWSYDTISMMWKISVWKNLSSISEIPMLHYLKKSASANSYKRHHMNNIRHRKGKCFQKLLTFSIREIIPIVPQSPIPIVPYDAQWEIHTKACAHTYCDSPSLLYL